MRQLRPFWSDEELRRIYDHMYDHTNWQDHKKRIKTTIDIATMFAEGEHWHSAADLSCGDGAIIKGLYANGVIDFAVMGDFVPAAHTHPKFVGKIEDTVKELQAEYPPFDLYVFSETMEHLEAPQEMLFSLRDVAKNMILSTPIDEDHQDNPEHYWSWGVQDVGDMLNTAGWTSKDVHILEGPWYNFQIWTASHE